MPATIKQIERPLDAYIAKGNTAEEFGVLLADATMPIDLDSRERRSQKYRARTLIRSLPGGAELLEAEDRS